ncbi:hypothetical protein Tco_0086409 [Tanacetum coccineum]
MTLAAFTITDKSLKDFDELLSTPIDFSGYILNGLKIKNLTQEIPLGLAFKLLKGTRSNYSELEYDFKECYKVLSEKLDWENPEGDDYLFVLSKPLPLITCGNHQRVLFKFFINNDLKYLQGGVSTMTYTTSTTKLKAAKYDLPGIEDMSFYAYARGMQLRGDVYSTKCILAVTHVKVMRKHGYGYLEEIVVRRADNALYRFKEGDDVLDFAIALRIFIKSLVIQKRVKDLQLGFEIYQKKINVTKPDTTKDQISKKGTRTLHIKTLKDSFMSMTTRGTDITKNIDMEYLPKRRWSTLEMKRAHFMIKDINKLLKERRMMRSLEKFVGGRLYGTELRLLQRTILLRHIVFTSQRFYKDIAKEVDGEDEESYAREFADSVFFNGEDDSGTRLEPRSCKENSKIVNDDDENEKEKKDDKKGDDNDDDVNDDHTNHTLIKA